MGPTDPSIRDTIRIPESAIHAFLDVLDREEASEGRLTGGINDRTSRRHRVHSCQPVVLEVTRPGEGTVRFWVVPRNLSEGGMSVIYGVFLHPRSSCVVHLNTLDGEKTAIVGHMTRCRYVGAHMHESGIKFESAIDISHYVRVCEDRAAKDESASAAPASESQRAIALAKELLELVQNGASPPLVTTILDGIRAIYAPTPAPTAETEPPASELAA